MYYTSAITYFGGTTKVVLPRLCKKSNKKETVNLYDLGLIYAIDCAREGNSPSCVVTMTLTSATCPVSDSLLDQVRNIGSLIEEEPNLNIEANLVFDPPWSQDKISIEAKLQLGML